MKRILLSATLLIAAVATAAATQTEFSANRLDGSRLIRRIERRLNVTGEQRVQLKAILQQERPTLDQLHGQLASERAELIALPGYDEAQTRVILSKYADANTAALLEHEKVRQQIFALMTPDQRQKLDALRSHFEGAFDQRLDTLADNL